MNDLGSSGFSNDSGLLKRQSNKRIWAVGGGKGGVGKSLVTANISICLALIGYKVVAVDLDLGGANLHTCLGVNIPEVTLSDYLSKKVLQFSDLLVKTPIQNLQIISGAQDELGIANLKHMHKTKIINKLHELDADIIIFDLGAGTSFNTIDFFLTADRGILVSLPEPTSIENTYRFIKTVFHRRLKMIEGLLDIEPLVNQVMNAKISQGQMTPVDLIKKIIEINPQMGMKLKQEIASLNPSLILNQVRTQPDVDIGFSIQSVCRRYFGIEMDYLGYLDYDPAVWQSVKKRRPLLLEAPNSKLVHHFDRMVHLLLEKS